MLEFVQLLKQRYQSVLSQLTDESNKSQYHKHIDDLVLAEAFLRKGQMLVNTPDYPLQIAVVGPTQAGKSSVVNMLLNSSAAGVSPLAGYTMHPQGFCDGVPLSACSGLQWYFGRFQQIQQSQLSKDRHDCYSLTENTTNSTFLPDSVLWDTPDFDSIDSVNYREGVIRTVALADMVVLVVSKEKYADQSVWDIMADIEALQQPIIICLNKLSEGSEALLINSLKDKWQQIRKDEFPQVIPLHYQKQTGMPQWPDTQQLHRLAKQVNRKKQSRLEQELLQKHWQPWLEPVLAEHSSLKDWQGLVDQVIQQGLNSYQRDYLNHPHHYETFQHALAELLNLLEIPGLAGILANTRRLLTWPIRKMMKIGRKRLHITESSQEITLLKQIAEHVLIQMADKLLNQAEQNRQSQWWKEFSSLLRTQRANILQDFADAAQQYHLAFQEEVENTANRLFHKLEEQPALLNSLRATRVTADAAVIALALHTGGIGMHDLIIAPAMLTVTSLLAESALGSYMGRVEAELKQRQLAAVKQALFTDSMKKKLLELSGQLSSVTYFNISPEQLQQAESQLIEKRHGLRLL
ncbi:GTPase domain-containing protein [Methyloglobulus sp.]|uniref:GTPase domain-containing protein n=1 Tax=Methyloglobulus sp. TaxID=2518622 RepID=UPI0032B78C6E